MNKSFEVREMQGIELLKLNCFSLLQDGFIPARYTADGININPALFIEQIPEGTQSLAIIVEDPDVPHGNFCHWVAWNIPVTHHIKEKENRGVFGINDFCNHGYNGPHPFSTIHRYYFKVYALDCLLNIPVSSTKWELKAAMKNHVLGFDVVTGRYQKKAKTPKNGNGVKAKPGMSEELKMLLSSQGNDCISILLPLHCRPSDQRMDKLHLFKIVRETIEQLTPGSSFSPKLLKEQVRKLHSEIVLQSTDKGIGIYISGNTCFHATFPFPVEEKIVVGKSFRLKELLIKENYSIPYSLVYIDEKEIRLYNGKAGELNEVKNGEFPMFFEEALDLQAPLINSFFARNAYVKNEKNVNDFLETHHKEFLRKANDVLSVRLQNAELLILSGKRRYLSEFIYHTEHKDKVAATVYGNYNRFTENDFSEMAWPSVKKYADEKIKSEITEYQRKLAEGVSEEGIVHVWDALVSDRGETLLVEKSFEIKGFVDQRDASRLYLHAPKTPHTVLPDAVDEIIKIALDKEVKVVFVEDGLLNRNMRIALVTKF